MGEGFDDYIHFDVCFKVNLCKEYTEKRGFEITKNLITQEVRKGFIKQNKWSRECGRGRRAQWAPINLRAD